MKAFPIPHMSQGPDDDLAHAMSLLEVISWSFDNAVEHGMSREGATDLYAVLCDVKLSLEPVMRFLSDLAYDEILADYRKARRELILKSYQPFASDDQPQPISGGAA